MLDPISIRESQEFGALAGLIGNTPLLRIDLTAQGKDITVYAKAEMFNYTGSIKDRMAFSIMKRARESGELLPGQPIAEATSGNAGIAIAALGRALGHPVTIFMPDWMSKERRSLIAGYGAELRLVSKEEGGFLGSIAMAEEMARDKGAFLTRQFANQDNCQAHFETTGPELWTQIQADAGELGGFVAGVGTGGTVMGVGRYLKQNDANVSIHPVEPAESPTLRTGTKVGAHRIQGVSDEFIPEIVDLQTLDDIIDVHDGDAILMAQKLCCVFGLGVGISSGGNLIAAIKLAIEKDDGKAVATVFCDNNQKYLSTDLAGEEPCCAGYLAPEVELRSLRAIRV